MSDRTTMENIGETLRLAREAKEMSITAAAMQTHLSTSVIEQLEGNCFDEIGAPVFTRGYLIRYARFLGIDGEAITDAFNQLRHEPTELHISKANIASYSRTVRRGRIRSWLAVIVLLVLAGVIAVQAVDPDSWLMEQFRKAFPEKPPKTTEEALSHEQERALPENDEGQAIEFQVAHSAPIVSTTEELILESTQEPAEERAPVNAVSPEPAVSESSDNAPVSPPPTAPESVTIKTVVLHVTGENWIEVRNRGNEVVVSRVFEQGALIDLPEEDAPYTINTGRPYDLQLIIAGKNEAIEEYRIEGSQHKFRIDLDR